MKVKSELIRSYPLPLASVLNKLDKTDSLSAGSTGLAKMGCLPCKCADDDSMSEGGCEVHDGPGASLSRCSGDPSGSMSGAPKYFRIAPANTMLISSSLKIDHECMFLFYYYSEVEVKKENSN